MHWYEASLAVMHTQLTCKAYGKQPEAAVEAAFAEVQRLELVFSRFLAQSEISQINAHAGKGMVDVSLDTIQVLEEAISIGNLSHGLFDVTIAPLMNLWDFTHAKSSPSPRAIEEVLMHVDYRKLEVSAHAHRAGLRESGMLLDVGGLAKGYAADCAKQVLKVWGITSAYINIGGNVMLLGAKPDESAWKVGIRHPRVASSLVGAIAERDVSVVTSGDYERFFIDSEGTWYHHIVNPKTGYSARSGLLSLTVVCPRSLHADALSTTLFIAGLEGSIKLLEQLPGVGIFAIDETMHGWITESLIPAFQPVTGLELSLLKV